jgi:penicillin V acylase-like amidase (Ntn superfamily)
MHKPITLTIFFLLLVSSQVSNSLACTTFFFDTPDGPIYAANFDYLHPGDGHVFINQHGIAKANFRKSINGETLKWVSKYGSATFNLLGREFPWGGMNEAGLVMTSLDLKETEVPEPDKRMPLGSGTYIQYILDTCGSVQEAIQKISHIRIVDDTPHFLIADASDDAAAIEYLDGQLIVYTGKSLPIAAMSNMSYARTLEAYKRGGPRWWWSNPGRSAERFADAAAGMSNYDASRHTSAVAYAFDILVNVVANPDTKWSIVYDIAKRKVWFGSVMSPAAKHLSLNAFDISCNAPLLMLDVNAGVKGNIERYFAPYDHDSNLKVFRNLTNRLGKTVSEEDATKFMHFLESFKCAY